MSVQIISNNQKQWLAPRNQFLELQSSSFSGNPLYLHTCSNSTVESISVNIHIRDYYHIHDLALWRYNTQYPIVKIYHGSLYKQSREGSYINVFVQHCQRTLATIHSITFPQALYLLRNSLTALEKLIEKFGFFDLTSKMIGINRNSECKVWVNEKFQQFKVSKTIQNQELMINKLFNLIEEHTQISNYSRQFFYSANKQCKTIFRSQKFISFYAYQKQIVIPPILVEDNRRRSFDPFLSKKITDYNNQFQSFIVDTCIEDNSNNKLLYKTQKKVKYFQPLFKKLPIDPSQISFTYNNNSSIINSPKCIYNMKDSKQTMAHSAENIQKGSSQYFGNSTMQLLPKLGKLSSVSLIHQSLVQNCQPVIQEQYKKMSIISTLSLKIGSQSSLNQNKIKVRRQKDQCTQSAIKQIFENNFQRNQWKKTISQLFSSDKNLKQSLSYGQQQKAYLKDLNLKKLGQFGRYITTSLLQKDQDQQNQIVNQFE